MRFGSSLLTAVVAVGCFFFGVWWGHGEMDGLLSTPPGGLYLEPRTRTVWSVFPDNPQLLHYSRIPTPEQARMSKLFPTIIRQEEAGKESTTTTTTTVAGTTTTAHNPRWVEIPDDATPLQKKEKTP